MSDRTIYFDSVRTSFGTFHIAASDQGLVQIKFPNHRVFRPRRQAVSHRARKVLKLGKRFLRSFFAGENVRHIPVPIDWGLFTPFDRKVLSTLTRIPPCRTISYGELGRKCGASRAARAVGNALHRNPIPIIIPCHRVVRKNRALGGYAGGIRWKKALLDLDQKIGPNR